MAKKNDTDQANRNLIITYLTDFCNDEKGIRYEEGEIDWLIKKSNEVSEVILEQINKAIAKIHTDPILINKFVSASEDVVRIKNVSLYNNAMMHVKLSTVFNNNISNNKKLLEILTKELNVSDDNSNLSKTIQNVFYDTVKEMSSAVDPLMRRDFHRDSGNRAHLESPNRISNFLGPLGPFTHGIISDNIPLITVVIANTSRYIAYIEFTNDKHNFSGAYAFSAMPRFKIKSKNLEGNQETVDTLAFAKDDTEAIDGAKLIIRDHKESLNKADINVLDIDVMRVSKDLEINNIDSNRITLIMRCVKPRTQPPALLPGTQTFNDKIVPLELLFNEKDNKESYDAHYPSSVISYGIKNQVINDDLNSASISDKIYDFIVTESDSYFRRSQVIKVANSILMKVANYTGKAPLVTTKTESGRNFIDQLNIIANKNYTNFFFAIRDIKNAVKDFYISNNNHGQLANVHSDYLTNTIIETITKKSFKKKFLGKTPDWDLMLNPSYNSHYSGMFGAAATITEIFSYVMDRMVADVVKTISMQDPNGKETTCIDLDGKFLKPDDICSNQEIISLLNPSTDEKKKHLYRIVQVAEGTVRRKCLNLMTFRTAVLESSEEDMPNIVIRQSTADHTGRNLYNLLDKDRLAIANRSNASYRRNYGASEKEYAIHSLEMVQDQEDFNTLCKGKSNEAIASIITEIKIPGEEEKIYSEAWSQSPKRIYMSGYSPLIIATEATHRPNKVWISDPEKLTINTTIISNANKWNEYRQNHPGFAESYNLDAVRCLKKNGYEKDNLTYYGHAFIATPFTKTFNVYFDNALKYESASVESLEGVNVIKIVGMTIFARQHQVFVETVIRNRIGNTKIEQVKNSIPVAFYRGLSRLMLTGKPFKISSSISSDPIEISNKAIRFNDQELSADNMLIAMPIKIVARSVWRELGTKFKDLKILADQLSCNGDYVIKEKQISEYISEINDSIDYTKFVNIMFMPFLNQSGMEGYNYLNKKEASNLYVNINDVYSNASITGLKLMNLMSLYVREENKCMTITPVDGNRSNRPGTTNTPASFWRNYVGNSFIDSDTNAYITYGISEPHDIDFNRFADVFCHKLCSPFACEQTFNQYMSNIDRSTDWASIGTTIDLFSCTIGKVRARVSISKPNSRGGRLCYINGKRLRREEIRVVLRNALCFDNQDAYDVFVGQVSQLSFRARALIKDGLRINIVTNSQKSTGIQFFFEFDKVDSEWALWIRDKSGEVIEKVKVKDIAPAVNNYWGARSQRGDTTMTISSFSHLLTSICDISLTQLSKIHQFGMKSFNERIARSRKFLEDTVQKTGAEYTTGPGTDIVGYKVRGKSGKDYMVACSRDLRVVTADPYNNDHGTRNFGAVYSYPAMEYVCIVDKSRDQSGYDVIAGRLLALRNDTVLVNQITTLARHVNLVE